VHQLGLKTLTYPITRLVATDVSGEQTGTTVLGCEVFRLPQAVTCKFHLKVVRVLIDVTVILFRKKALSQNVRSSRVQYKISYTPALCVLVELELHTRSLLCSDRHVGPAS
jgi:hypothetical protein